MALFGSVVVPTALAQRAVDQIEESVHSHVFHWLPVHDDMTCVFGLTKNTETQMTTLTRPTLECPHLTETLLRISCLYKFQVDDSFEFTNIEVCKSIHGMQKYPWHASRAVDPCCICLLLTLGEFEGGDTEVVDLRDSSTVRLDTKEKLMLTNTAFPIKVASFAGIQYTIYYYTSRACLSLVADDMAYALLTKVGFPTATAANYEAVCRAANVKCDIISANIVHKSEVKDWLSVAERVHNELNMAQDDGDSVTVLLCRLLDLIHKLRTCFPLEISERPVATNQREAQGDVAEDFVKTLTVATTVLGVCQVHEGAVESVSRKRTFSPSATLVDSDSDSGF